MKLIHDITGSKAKDGEHIGKKEGKTPYSKHLRIKTAAALAAFFSIVPLAERAANAQNVSTEGTPTANSDEATDAAYLKATTPADTPTDSAQPATSASNDAPATASTAPKTTTAAEGTVAVDGDNSVVSHNLLFNITEKNTTQYTDSALAPFPDAVSINGKPRGITLDNSWDFGGNLIGNEAGMAVFGTVRYRDLASLDLGNIWFGELAAPFAKLMVRPELNVWRFKAAYYGSVAFAGHLPSWLYSSHSVGIGYSQPIGKNFTLRLGGIIGGALSYPTWDDIYFNFSTGLSAEIAKTLLIYAMPTCYFAAEDPMKTAYVGYYRPKFQSLEIGAQIALKQYTVRVFTDIGLIGEDYGIYSRYGFRGTRTFNVTNRMDVDLWASFGMTQWAKQLGGRIDPAVMVGATAVFGGKYVNSTNQVSYSHLQDGGVRFAKTDFPTKENPGPYGFGRSGDAAFDVPINAAKERIVTATSFEDFKHSYAGASSDEITLTTRFLGAFLLQVAYANDAYQAMTTGNIFDKEVQRIAGADEEEIFRYIQGYVNWYENHSSNEPLPENLKNGIAVCAGIHWVMAEFMRANGVDAVVMSVNTTSGPHMITAAQIDGKTLLFNYGNTYETPKGTLDQTIRFYGQSSGAPTFESQFFGPHGYVGTDDTSEGRLHHKVIGIDNTDVLQKEFFGVR